VTVAVVRGDAACLPLPDGSVDLIVTSPPYFGLRAYTDGGEVYAGQIGSEATPAEWLAALLECTREWVRILKPSGSLFVNLGDKYAGSRMDGSSGWETAPLDHDPRKLKLSSLARSQGALRTSTTLPAKSLMGLPWRYALACTDQLGLILRAEIVWSKPNGLPESVTDRVRRAHEQVFHFTRQPRYYTAVDEIREPHTPGPLHRAGNGSGQKLGSSLLSPQTLAMESGRHPLGKLPGSVWTIPSQPLTVPPDLGVDHFAAYPMELPRRIILGWSPPGVCTVCGEGRRPVVDRVTSGHDNSPLSRTLRVNGGMGGTAFNRMKTLGGGDRLTGYACACPEPDAPTRPSVVVDPFGGTGTTALVAHMHGRTGITVDRSADYSRLAAWRTTDPGQRAAALQVDRPPVVMDGQAELFGVDL
jgi:DNA modification methylase